MNGWEQFLIESDKGLRHNELNRGLTYTPDPRASVLDAVEDYCDGFAWNGAGAREITGAVMRDERSVKRALKQLVETGKLRVEESLTRGPKASRRKTYFIVSDNRPVTESMPDHFDFYGTPDDRLSYGAGGGRKVQPRPSADGDLI